MILNGALGFLCIKYLLKFLGSVVQNLMKLLADVMLIFLSWNMLNTLMFFAEKISMYLKIP